MQQTSGGLWVPEGLAEEQEAKERERIAKITAGNLEVNQRDLEESLDEFEWQQKAAEKPQHGVLFCRVHVDQAKVDKAIAFWKPLYFNLTKEGRHLNGIEAYALGDEKVTARSDKAPYIAMCNLMALEALRRMGDHNPTQEDPTLLAHGTERERDIADFWKKTFAPTECQVRWAWQGAMAVMAGEPNATDEILEHYQDQLP